MREPDAQVTVDVDVHSIRARENWQLVKTAAAGARALTAFKTLRDMHSDVVMDFSQLEVVSRLGEGAYGTVERAKQTNSDGTVVFVAIKRLRQAHLADELAEHSGRTCATLDEVLPQITRLALSARETSANDPKGGSRQDAQVRAIIGGLSEDDQDFLTEISVMKHLSHPYIIRYLGCGVMETREGRFLSVAEEVCEGGQLGKLVQRASWSRRGKRLYSYADAARWSEQAAKALHYLHSAQPQVLHRDVKASNLLLTRTGRAGDIRLSDFGLIKLRKIAKLGYQHATKEDVKYVMTGETGSYLYMAPEVLNGAPYSEKVDVFSLGIVMFELFTMTSLGGLVSSNGGGGPEDDVYARYAQRVAAGHREKLPHTWPQSLQDLVADCWRQEPSMRPSAHDVVCRLQRMQADIAGLDAQCPRGVADCEEVKRPMSKLGRLFKGLRRK